MLASKINKCIYIPTLNEIEFSQLRSRRPNIDYTGLEGFSDSGLLDGVQKRVKGSCCTYVTARPTNVTRTRRRRRAIKIPQQSQPVYIICCVGTRSRRDVPNGGLYDTGVYTHTLYPGHK